MSDFSRSPLELLLANQQKGYVGIHIEQGVPILDRDLNLLQDLVAATVRSVVARYIGNGIPAGVDGFAIQALPAPQGNQDFRIAAGDGGPGACLVGGIEVSIPAAITYSSQVGVPALTAPSDTQPDPRTDIVYLDIFLTEVDGAVDTDLTNSQDVGIQTSVRLKPDWVVRVAEGVPMPAPPPGHEFYPLAQLRRPRNQDLIDTTMITDLRQRRLTVADMEQRLSLLEQVPPAKPVKITLTPTLAATDQPWQHAAGAAFKPGPATAASGMMTVMLPQGATIQSFRATGLKNTGNLRINLQRQRIAPISNPELLVGLTPGDGGIDQTATVPTTDIAKVDNDQFRYYITAEVDHAVPAEGLGLNLVIVNCFQITYIPS